jgi:hypothetical protein
MYARIPFSANLSTTAMGILPHKGPDQALALARSLDIPFWPQLPRLSFYEDMYVQAMEHFPGAVFDEGTGRVYVDSERFLEDLPRYLEEEEKEEYFRLSRSFSAVFRRFLASDLSPFAAVHGQIISPVSLCLKIVDEHGKPMVYNDEARVLAFEFIRKKANAQYRELKARNRGAFVWIDDPGLEFVFSALSGYDSVRAGEELTGFLEEIEGPRGVHLCGRPDWDFLLSLDVEILSINAYAFGEVFASYGKAKRFFDEGKIMSWGIVPTGLEDFTGETVESLMVRLEGIWEILARQGLDRRTIARQSLLAPATCNLLNLDGAATVERSFETLNRLSERMKERYL